MKYVFKYALDKSKQIQNIDMPRGSQILSCMLQDNQLVVYALVTPDKKPVSQKFVILNTGNQYEDDKYGDGGEIMTFVGRIEWTTQPNTISSLKHIRHVFFTTNVQMIIGR